MKKSLTHFICLFLLCTFFAVELQGSRLKVHNYTGKLNPKFRKKRRASTRYIIVHTSEAGFASTLRTLTRGKRVGRHRYTYGGHANYLVARNGKVYSVVPHRYRSDHAGLSMWSGLRNLSSHSIGIELVGYHYGKITDSQYRNLSKLLKFLMKRYRVKEKNVLTHSQISYGRPNKWFSRNHRGRKRCAMNFDRRRAGLKSDWTYDPDVRAGRLQKDPQIASIFYGPQKPFKRSSIQKKIVEVSNIISLNNSAWNIAGEDYNSSRTLYLLPDGRQIPGNRLGRVVKWSRIPAGTKVLLNYSNGTSLSKGPVHKITADRTAWSIAGKLYRSKTVKYLFPGNRIVSGNRIKDWDNIPENTLVIVGYKGPFKVTRKNFSYFSKLKGVFFVKNRGFMVSPPKRYRSGIRFFRRI